MQLGTKGRYAVMAMIELVVQEKDHSSQKPWSLSLIAEHQEISALYLEQIFVKLRKKGLVQSVRGSQGGYILGKPPAEISIADIMEAVGESFYVTRCTPQQKIGCLRNQVRCRSHYVWEELERRLSHYLHSISLEDVYLNPQGKLKQFY